MTRRLAAMPIMKLAALYIVSDSSSSMSMFVWSPSRRRIVENRCMIS